MQAADAPRDSAGPAWDGRTLPTGDFAGDDGTIGPALARALAARGDGSGDDGAVVAALASSRVLVTVVAVQGEGAERTDGTADKQADMALVTLTGPDGRRALPVFSSVGSLRQWDPTARPVPVECRRAAVSAVAEGCELMVLDPGGPQTFVVGRPALWAIGQGRPWVPAERDPDVQAALDAVAAATPQVAAISAQAGESAQLRVVVAIEPGLDAEQVRAVALGVGEQLQASDVVRERVDGLELKVVSS